MKARKTDTDAYDKGEHVRDVFAHFGRAFYMSNVFETGLALAILQLDFLTETLKHMKREGRHIFDRRRYESEFDAYMSRQHAQTLGNLIKRAQSLAELDDALKAEIMEAKTRRDFLTHHFFRERSEEFATRSGRDKMIAEAEEAHAIFMKADRILTQFMEPYLNKLGITRAAIDAESERYLKSLADD